MKGNDDDDDYDDFEEEEDGDEDQLEKIRKALAKEKERAAKVNAKAQ